MLEPKISLPTAVLRSQPLSPLPELHLTSPHLIACKQKAVGGPIVQQLISTGFEYRKNQMNLQNTPITIQLGHSASIQLAITIINNGSFRDPIQFGGLVFFYSYCKGCHRSC
ncbi:hypothetical protein M5K25_004726 [Dendrobium thyrsiflorum]|uniref:Uncharacterized protein n=1 Tax=Dendrobium thyrsiflorum TaxID=117978 RepID=A0ABD0VGF6_DENTH